MTKYSSHVFCFKQIFPEKEYLSLFEDKYETDQKQSGHTLEAALTVSMDLKSTLEGLATALFGKGTSFVFSVLPHITI